MLTSRTIHRPLSYNLLDFGEGALADVVENLELIDKFIILNIQIKNVNGGVGLHLHFLSLSSPHP